MFPAVTFSPLMGSRSVSDTGGMIQNAKKPIPKWLKELMPFASPSDLTEAEENFWQFILVLCEINKKMHEEKEA